MLKNRRMFFSLYIFFLIFISVNNLFSQNESLIVKGKIYSSLTKTPVEFATLVVIEAKVKVYATTGGDYEVRLPKSGDYTFVIRADGHNILRLKVAVESNLIKDFSLAPIVSKSATGIIVAGERDLQKLGRITMTRDNIKDIPASFGDSVSALTALPGVNRTFGGFFGPLVIRGGDYIGNKYYVDDIPIYQPLHFGGLHSVISSNLINEIDLYSSAFPVQFGNASSSIININTINEVKQFGGYSDVSALSATALIQTPIYKDSVEDLSIGSPFGDPGEKKTAGYFIASGRTGYYDLVVAPLVKLITGDPLPAVPEYWDYQVKMKYFFTPANSVTLFLMGSRDYLKFLNSDNNRREGADPLASDAQFGTDVTSHSQGIYYDYQPSKKFQNRLLAFSSIIKIHNYATFPNGEVNPALKDININSIPYNFGIKEKFVIDVFEKIWQIRVGVEYNLYYFIASGKTFVINQRNTGDILGNSDALSPFDLNIKTVNNEAGGYLENKFTFGGFTFVPGVRSDYLASIKKYTVDPRGLMTYEFSTKTTISIAGGMYSYFYQVNPNYFNIRPDISSTKEIKPEKAVHTAAGIEQVLGLYTIKAEGFYNYFYDIWLDYYHQNPDGSVSTGLNSGKIRARGVEILLRKDTRERTNDFFAWLSYTYTLSSYRSGLPATAGYGGVPTNIAADIYGNVWIPYNYERQHSVKLTGGYRYNRHTISGKFQLYTSYPYTPYVNGVLDTNYLPGIRYVPVLGKTNSAHFPVEHSLDVRYSYKTDHSWGYVTWYLEIINIYNNKTIDMQQWSYDRPYGNGNPKQVSSAGSLSTIPNFGVEVKF